jgi:hypothetical protein
MTEVGHTSETSVCYETTRRYNQESCHLRETPFSLTGFVPVVRQDVNLNNEFSVNTKAYFSVLSDVNKIRYVLIIHDILAPR